MCLGSLVAFCHTTVTLITINQCFSIS
uniref:Uncharacterized protein n=1 Tax=Anguilla anguilla TaxID=7936 RepID=A0A0E9R3B8_ANGAN